MNAGPNANASQARYGEDEKSDNGLHHSARTPHDQCPEEDPDDRRYLQQLTKRETKSGWRWLNVHAAPEVRSAGE
jgi:hypothetical protein